MRAISAASIIEKNKIASGTAWPVLLEIQVPGNTIRLAGNNEDIEFDGHTFQAFPFSVDLPEVGAGEIPAVTVSVSNVTGTILQIIEQNNGVNGIPVVIRVVSAPLGVPVVSEFEQTLHVESATYDEQNITFKLGGQGGLTRRVPRRRFLKNFCHFEYGGIECGVSAATVASYPSCNKTQAHCQQRGNFVRFGGFPWLPER